MPRARDRISAFGVEVDGAYLRLVLMGLAVIVTVALIGIGIESMRLRRMEAAALGAEQALSSRSLEQEEAKVLALGVARYEEIARESAAVHRSGALAAAAIARIGNAVPPGVYLDSLATTPNAYELTGGARSIDDVGTAIQSLGNGVMGHRASLVSIENRDRAIHFTARLPQVDASSAP